MEQEDVDRFGTEDPHIAAIAELASIQQGLIEKLVEGAIFPEGKREVKPVVGINFSDVGITMEEARR